MFLLFDIFFLVIAIIYLPYYFIIRKKWHGGFSQRFGFLDDSIRQLLSGQKNIWVHAVSVGEVLAVCDIVSELKDKFPDHQIVFSTVTTTGNDLAKTKLGDKAVVIYAPLDFSWVARTFVKVIKPVLYLSAETEIWPNLFSWCCRKKRFRLY